LSRTNGQTMCSGAASGVRVGNCGQTTGHDLGHSSYVGASLTADGGVTRMAQGKVSIMAVNEKLGKPTANIPKWCLEKLGLA
jgi:hypothetical protein